MEKSTIIVSLLLIILVPTTMFVGMPIIYPSLETDPNSTGILIQEKHKSVNTIAAISDCDKARLKISISSRLPLYGNVHVPP